MHDLTSWGKDDHEKGKGSAQNNKELVNDFHLQMQINQFYSMYIFILCNVLF